MTLNVAFLPVLRPICGRAATFVPKNEPVQLPCLIKWAEPGAKLRPTGGLIPQPQLSWARQNQAPYSFRADLFYAPAAILEVEVPIGFSDEVETDDGLNAFICTFVNGCQIKHANSDISKCSRSNRDALRSEEF